MIDTKCNQNDYVDSLIMNINASQSLLIEKQQRLDGLSHAQLERLAYIDFRLYFLGEIGRPDLANRFGIAPAAATRDLAMYREVAPRNIESRFIVLVKYLYHCFGMLH
jgi:hypothetical protein